jgi:hypothetical protein
MSMTDETMPTYAALPMIRALRLALTCLQLQNDLTLELDDEGTDTAGEAVLGLFGGLTKSEAIDIVGALVGFLAFTMSTRDGKEEAIRLVEWQIQHILDSIHTTGQQH